jgi:hypothetical protein
VREFASKVETVRDAEKKPYQAILVARSGFVNAAGESGRTEAVLSIIREGSQTAQERACNTKECSPLIYPSG